jgi:hypothetical protein
MAADSKRETSEMSAVIRWVDRIERRDRRTFGQLIAIDAAIVRKG